MSKLKLQAIIIGLVATLLAGLMSWYGYRMMTRVDEVSLLWRDYNENETVKSKALHDFTADFGVGSFVHVFKVYILTQDSDLIPQIDYSIEQTYLALDQYMQQEITEEEEEVLLNLRHYVDIYVSKYEFAQRLIAQGMSPGEVEIQVQVNDQPAQAAVGFLLEMAKLRSKTKEVGTQEVLTEISQGLYWASGLIVLILLVAVLMVRFLHRAWLANQKINEVSDYLRGIIEAAPDAMLGVDSKGQIIQANEQAGLLFGYSYGDLLYKSVEELLPEQFRKMHANMRENYFNKPRLRLMGQGLELSGVKSDGEVFPIEISLNYTVLNNEQLAIATIRDVTQRRQTELKMRQAATVFDNTDEAIVVADANRRIINVNRAFCKMTGYDFDESQGRDDLFYCQDPECQRQQLQSGLDKYGQWRGELVVKRKLSQSYPVWQCISEVKDSQGEVSSYISLFSDISVIKQTEEWLNHLAHHDSLTGLPNRALFSSRLGQAIELAKRADSKFALLFLDLDRFKIINDTLGHAVGDRMLNEVGERLKSVVRGDDTVARLGGDEFTIILNSISHSDDVARVAEKIIEMLVRPMEIEDREVVISTSIGISLYPDDAQESEGLAKAADAAMYRAKEFGRNNFQFYSAELTHKAFERLSMEQGLRQALGQDQFFLLYQPQICLQSRAIVGVEALIRWRHPEMGVVSPARFIPVAEEMGMIESIGAWVLKQACAQARHWIRSGLPRLRMSVNVSLKQMVDNSAINHLLTTLEELNLHEDGLGLDLEITESALKMAERSVSVLRDLKSKGVGLAIDDFGTGYSSLSRLKQLPIDTLKIDRSFVEEIPYENDNNAIATAIIAMGQSLKLNVIAEGVENPEQEQFLIQQGCAQVQGYLYCEPVSPEQIAEILQGGKFQKLG